MGSGSDFLTGSRHHWGIPTSGPAAPIYSFIHLDGALFEHHLGLPVKFLGSANAQGRGVRRSLREAPTVPRSRGAVSRRRSSLSRLRLRRDEPCDAPVPMPAP